MTKVLRHFTRRLILGKEDYKQFALIGFNTDDGYNDGVVTLLRCKADNLAKELRYWGFFGDKDILAIKRLACRKRYRLSDDVIVIRLS